MKRDPNTHDEPLCYTPNDEGLRDTKGLLGKRRLPPASAIPRRTLCSLCDTYHEGACLVLDRLMNTNSRTIYAPPRTERSSGDFVATEATAKPFEIGVTPASRSHQHFKEKEIPVECHPKRRQHTLLDQARRK
jgi:hypothetical protein